MATVGEGMPHFTITVVLQGSEMSTLYIVQDPTYIRWTLQAVHADDYDYDHDYIYVVLPVPTSGLLAGACMKRLSLFYSMVLAEHLAYMP